MSNWNVADMIGSVLPASRTIVRINDEPAAFIIDDDGYLATTIELTPADYDDVRHIKIYFCSGDREVEIGRFDWYAEEHMNLADYSIKTRDGRWIGGACESNLFAIIRVDGIDNGITFFNDKDQEREEDYSDVDGLTVAEIIEKWKRKGGTD